MERRWSPRVALALIAITLLAHAPALLGDYLWDDVVLRDSPHMDDASGLAVFWTEPRANEPESHYWPLTYTSLWLERQVLGEGPFGHHLGNLALHALDALLLWRVLVLLALPGAAFAAFVFAVHPVHVESVAWIIERKDVLSAAFYLASTLAWLRWRRDGSRASFAFSMVFYACGLLSKSAGLGLPIALAAIDWWKRERWSARDLLALAPFAAIGVAHACFDLALSRSVDPVSLGLSLGDRAVLAARSLIFYLGKVLWPLPTMTFYPRAAIDGSSALAWLWPLALVALAAGLWLARGRLGRGPIAALVWFVALLAPMLGLIDFYFLKYAWVADRFQYLASAAPIAAIAALGARAPWAPVARRSVAALVIGALAVATFDRCRDYRDERRFFERAVEANPDAWPAWIQLGQVAALAGDSRLALERFARAASIAPNEPRALGNHGMLLLVHGDQAGAGARFERALAIDPRYAFARLGLGMLAQAQDRVDDAIAHYRAALELAPRNADARRRVIELVERRDGVARAVEELEGLLARAPRAVDAWIELAELHERAGRVDRAVEAARRACAIAPRDPRARGLLERLLAAR